MFLHQVCIGGDLTDKMSVRFLFSRFKLHMYIHICVYLKEINGEKNSFDYQISRNEPLFLDSMLNTNDKIII